MNIQSWLNQRPVSSKIATGYILSLGITIIGATTGLFISNQYENNTQELTEDVIEEIKLISELEVDFMYVIMHQQAVTSSLDDFKRFQHEYEELKIYESRLNQSWIALNTSYQEAEVVELNRETELMHLLMKEYEENIIPYSESFHQDIQQLTAESLTASQILAAQRAMKLKQDSFHQKAEEISQLLSEIDTVVIKEAEEAQEIIEKAQLIHNLIIITSILLSVSIALLLSRYTANKISIPIQKLTEITQKITQKSDFSIQVPVSSQDEIGSLTQSFNHLISQVNILLEEQKQSAQAQLMQHEKLSSLGQMIAGVAHEINNPVSCISGNISYLTEYCEQLLELIHTYQQEIKEDSEVIQEKIVEIELDYIEEDLPNLLQAVKVSAERTKQIAASLKNFSRLDEAAPQNINIHECLDSSLLILKNRTKQGISIQKQYGDLPLIEGYFSSLSQVFINIINNAIDALIEQNKTNPTITIMTKNLDSNQIMIKLLDNGPGISTEHQQKIFESFFTTKPTHTGTGLGLAISRQIIEQKHHGSLECSSQVGEGTEFVIILPKK
ncbi:MAG: ATP-binding protein [Microcoleaceae cyanobacterium]